MKAVCTLAAQDVLLGEGAAVWGGLHIGSGHAGARLLPALLLQGPPRAQPAALLPGAGATPTSSDTRRGFDTMQGSASQHGGAQGCNNGLF